MNKFNLINFIKATTLSIVAFSFGTGSAIGATPAPKPVLVANSEDQNPFAIRLDMVINSGFSSSTFSVPAGQRLVIDYISADAGISSTSKSVLFDVATIVGGHEVEAHLPMTTVGQLLGQTVLAVSSPVKIFADPGSTVTIAILSDSTSGGLIVGVFGHLVPVN
ncbi:hypothetical protein [Methylomonas sp. AM2-LC]|uniref:hypothetical protein n=1 Tax=Methylomonas sp. AM2-LC TaxID=3153301 RepID=UPI0032675A02